MLRMMPARLWPECPAIDGILACNGVPGWSPANKWLREGCCDSGGSCKRLLNAGSAVVANCQQMLSLINATRPERRRRPGWSLPAAVLTANSRLPGWRWLRQWQAARWCAAVAGCWQLRMAARRPGCGGGNSLATGGDPGAAATPSRRRPAGVRRPAEPGRRRCRSARRRLLS